MKTFLSLILLSLTIGVFSQTRLYQSLDTITFEKNYDYLKIDTSSSNIWQIGKPQKSFFNSALSSENGIITDTSGYYPKNNYSYFDLLIGESNNPDYPYNIFIEFNHKYNTDTLKDGGYITFSFDKGTTWYNFFNYTDFMNSEYFLITESDDFFNDQTSQLSNGELGFSGTSNGWHTTMICWYMPLASVKSTSEEPADTMYVRFNFVSDSIENSKEGWLIDDIYLYIGDIPGAVHVTSDSRVKVYPLPSSQYLTFGFDKTYSNSRIDLMDINGKLVFSDKYLNVQEVPINVANFVPGLYIAKITLNNTDVIFKKVLINSQEE